MRFKHFKPRTLTEADIQQLDELRMGPSNLQQFAQSDAAKGIMAGFEAELVFTGLGEDNYDDYDMEPDMDADERCRSIQQVIDFFENDEYGYGIHGREADKLQEGLDEMYWEWHEGAMRDAFADEQEDLIKKVMEDEGDWDLDAEIEKQLNMMDLSEDEISDALIQGEKAPKFTKSSEQEAARIKNEAYDNYMTAVEEAEGLLDELVQDEINTQGKKYDLALDEFRDSFYIDDDSGFFGDVGLQWMSDIRDQFDLMWPVMTGAGGGGEGGFSEANAENLADSLSKEIGVKTKVSSGYHSAKRDNVTWIFEPDSSLDSDDPENMPVEIVSPPMPLETCLKQMENFFTWAESNGAYSNESTGFHMGVSLPHRGGDVDYVKLALFLGDEHVLESFGRSSNTYTAAAIKKIRDRVKGNPEAVGNALELMKNNLIELAQKALEINNHGFGKYTSINPQGGTDSTRPDKERGAKYIEFRSAGGTNYFEDIDKLKNTLLRYAQAMTIAANPAAERKEYYKKLYKLIAPKEGDPALDLFSRFATGAISSEELKKTWADKQLGNEPKGDWKLWDASGKAVPGEEFHGYSKSDAWEKAKKGISPGGSMEGFQKEYKLLPMKSQTGDWEVYRVDTGETLETLHGFATKGEAADSIYDKYSEQGVAFNLRPADPDAPEKPLSKREMLAKRIKAPKAGPEYNYEIVNKTTGEVEDKLYADSQFSANGTFEKWAYNKGLKFDDYEVRPIEKRTNDPKNVRRNWEFYYEPNGRVLDTVNNASYTQAETVLADVQRRHGNAVSPDQIRMRSVPTEQSAERAANRTPQQDTSQPPAEFSTQRPSTGDYYEVRGGNDRVYGYLPGSVGNNMDSADIALHARRYVNNLTGDNSAYVQYRAGDPVQATAPNGVPLWEIYSRDTGHVIHTLADHDQRSAWTSAQQYLRDISAEDPSEFSVRPRMSA